MTSREVILKCEISIPMALFGSIPNILDKKALIVPECAIMMMEL